MQGNGERVILLVDDEPNNREILRMFLSWSGHNVIEAANGQEAIQLVAKDCPDLIIMDLAMPVMDGFTATQILRQTTQVPIIAYTAFDTPYHRAEALKIGFNEFLTKPLDLNTLGLVLERFLDGNVSKEEDRPNQTAAD